MRWLRAIWEWLTLPLPHCSEWCWYHPHHSGKCSHGGYMPRSREVQNCTRPPNHSGPCNGWDCHVPPRDGRPA